ncbi:NADP-dependent oxidoreductase domain-containing protein [Desarmillaria tabescens]|uniref:NADP-dependent oxidoreductase domain-containing protein n=1 Tax=Armillaria tabescens TaxID=1929756 RepID=A0AA39JUB5_ARMTA|nr:NADP-dependent oxidoreductase domain-containing protein [Desarmillaria tabescens]KAK0449062.1 NADP-dependent oxidoreductase domain-containing protein [Desarmillaria tabescens]
MSLFPVANDPPTKLGIYRVLSSRAGVRVSPLALGAMSIGDKWGPHGMGSMHKESMIWAEISSILRMDRRVIRIVHWTDEAPSQYTTNYKRGNDAIAQKRGSDLKKLRTSYIDILYLYWWTSIPEVMGSLHNLVTARKVLYLGISDTSSWVVALANQYAIDHGKTPFVVDQGRWSILDRSLEREIVPMAKTLGLAISPRGVLAEGKMRTDADEQRRRETALEKVATEIGVGDNITAVAIAYVMQKAPYVFPIIGGRKVEHLKANMKALDISLSKEQIEYLDDIVPFDPGFPTTAIGDGSSYNIFLASTAKMAKLPTLQPIKP